MTVVDDVKKKIQAGAELFVIWSDCTKLPYVECDAETFDDEILAFTEKEYAQTKQSALTEAGEPVHVLSVPVKNRLPFFSGLFAMGVNAVLINQGTKGEMRTPLDEIVKRPELPRYSEEAKQQVKDGKLAKDMKFRVENPEFHLTAIYLMQALKSGRAKERKEELAQLQEEMLAHYHRGYFIAVRTEKGVVPLLKRPDGDTLQPLFSDAQEFMKFQQVNKGVTLRTSIVTEQEFRRILDPSASGTVINPMGVGVVLKVRKKEQQKPEHE